MQATSGPRLVPTIGVLREAGTLHAHDAEALAGWRFHDNPSFQSVDYLRTQFRQARHFGRNIIGFNVDVYAAFMVHALDFHDGLIGRRLQHPISIAAARMLEVHRTTQRIAPEFRSFIDIRRTAIDQHGAQARMMHIGVS